MSAHFEGRALAIATMHQKETVLTPRLEGGLGVKCVVLSQMDTDQFGTFTGQIPRHLSVLETARAKCDYAHFHYSCDLVLASEGTFGPHPSLPFISSDHEFLLLKDYLNGLEVFGSALSPLTNHHHASVATREELLDFASAAGFPSHGLILRPTSGDLPILKGIVSDDVLAESFDRLLEAFGSVRVETDMRAQFNPTRLKVIDEAAVDLINNALSHCPSCGAPGFSVVSTEAGLPCRVCGNPTRSLLKELFRCRRCDYCADRRFPDGKEFEDPMYCDYCNP